MKLIFSNSYPKVFIGIYLEGICHACLFNFQSSRCQESRDSLSELQLTLFNIKVPGNIQLND